MDISFNGIRNVDIKTLKAKGYGMYLNNAYHLEEGEKYYTLVSLSADLDDTVMKGEDISQKTFKPHRFQYLESLQKLKNYDLTQKILRGNKPYNVQIIMKHYNAPDNLGEVNRASFTINGENVSITNRNFLSLYTFMARFTRDILKLFKLSDDAKQSIKLMNDSIAKEAEEFIDNITCNN